MSNNILITGATSGLGRRLSMDFANEGQSVIAVGRNLEKLQSLVKFSKNITPICCDFESETSKFEFYKQFDLTCVNRVVHCLGGGFKLSEDLLGTKEFLRLFNLNFLISAEINSILIPKMKKNKRGWIVHIGSIASREVTASVGYSSIKAMIPAYVKVLGRKLICDGVYMSAIIPGGMIGEDGSMDRLNLINSEVVNAFIKNKRPTGNLSKVDSFVKWVEMLIGENAVLHASNSIILDEAESTSI